MSYVCIRNHIKTVANGYKNGCTTICRTHITSIANIVQTFLISKKTSEIRLVVFPNMKRDYLEV